MKVIGRVSTLALALAWGLAAAPALAQSNADNAVENADDAFGTSTGHDNIGVYDENSVRGFSPGSAGNFRMEGMYFDIQGGLGNRVIDGETIRVGTAAQGYLFPAPTGVVDLQLKKAGDKTSISPFISADSFGSRGFEVDAQIPLAGSKLGLAAGAGVYDNNYSNGGSSVGINLGGVLRWRPSKSAELLTFANHQQFWDDTSNAIYITKGNFLPPRMKLGVDINPVWTRNEHHADTYGTVGHVSFGDWTLRGGLFRSSYSQDSGYSNLVFVNQDRSTERRVYATPASGSASWSGELRLSRRFIEGPRQHLITLALRGRSIDAHYGGGVLTDPVLADIDEVFNPPKPVFDFTALTDDVTRQSTGGISYSVKWKGLGEFTAGVQRTHYVKELGGRRTTDATLPYFSAALTVIPKVILYGSYVRGLEDSGSAPGYATNANEILPASRTSQYDFGVRWSPLKDTTLIVGYFRIAKPLIDIDQKNRYDFLGEEVHKGIEFSLITNPSKWVRIVAGGV
ncbi:MAG: hypothetical protein ACKOVA_12810, partial [Novosphingobium sp.]